MSENTEKLSLDDVIEKLRGWPAASAGSDALSSVYVGGLMLEAADWLQRMRGELEDWHAREAGDIGATIMERARLPATMICVVPAGWALVPAEPTDAMTSAGATENTDADREDIIWRAMIMAAPTSPLPAHPFSDVIPLPNSDYLSKLVKGLRRADIQDQREKLVEVCRQAAQVIQIQQAALDKAHRERRIPADWDWA